MLRPVYLNKFDQEIEKSKKRGKNIEKLKRILKLLIEEVPLPEKNRNHKLKGNYTGYWECHIEPDWLLVYKKTETHVYFARLGSHSDLF